MRPIFILSAEYSAPVDAVRPRAVFERARRDEAPPVDALMTRAGQRALAALPPGVQATTEHLLVTTMPYTDRSDAAHSVLPVGAVNLPSALKQRLGLASSCQARFELGTSDAGAALFASAFRLLRGLPHSSTALVIAGQTMFGGVRAIDTVAQVIEPDERRQGLRMIPVGDALLDALWARLQADGRGARISCGDEQDAAATPAHLASLLAQHKLRLAAEYGAALANEADPEGAEDPPMARWLRRSHVAPAATGACAVLLTSDAALVDRWRAAGGHERVVRVLGVGEGDDDPAVARRGEPLLFLKAMRQALVHLRRSTGVEHGFVRQSAFAVLHDAFPSIELAFLQALGFTAIEGIERAVTEWPNPFGGLTAFGHALAASGLVQIAKAFHIFTRPPAYVTSGRSSHHPDFSGGDARVHCVTTSVGGPMTHVVATLLESAAVALDAPLPTDWHGPDPPRRREDGTRAPESTDLPGFEGKSAWVARISAAWRAAQAARAGEGGLGVVEGRTALDLRTVPLPLPAGFIEGWQPATPLSRGLRAALGGDEPRAVSNAVRALAAASGRPVGEVWTDLRLPAALVLGGGSAFGGAPRALCLMPDPEVPVNALVRVSKDEAELPWVDGVEAAHPELVPPWHATSWREDAPSVSTPSVSTPGAEAAAQAFDPPAGARSRAAAGPAPHDERGGWLPTAEATALVSVLRSGRMSRETLRHVFELTERLLTELRGRTGEAAPAAAVALASELVLAPDPDRWRLAGLLARLSGPDAHPIACAEVAGYCEFKVARTPAADDQAAAFATLHEAIGHARGLLGGTHVHPSHVADTFAVAARGGASEAELWPRMLRFAQAVYGRCLRNGLAVRAAVAVARSPVVQRGGNLLALPGGGQLPVHLVMTGAVAFRQRVADADGPSPPGHGVAVVLVDPVGDDAGLRARCAALWAQAGGVRPLTPMEDGWLPVQSEVRAFYAVRAVADVRRLVLRAADAFER